MLLRQLRRLEALPVLMIEREQVRAAVRALGCDSGIVDRHIESEGWTGIDQRVLEVAGLLSVLYREVGRLLAMAVSDSEVPCGYIAMPGTMELPEEDHQAAARWEVSWAKERLGLVAYDPTSDKWLTGYAAAEQAVTAAEFILKAVTPAGMPAGPRTHGWDDGARALRLALRLIDEAIKGRIRTKIPGE